MDLFKSLDELVHHSKKEIPHPLVMEVCKTIRDTLVPGGIVYNRYINELRLIISRSESNDVFSNIKNQAGKIVWDADWNVCKNVLADLHIISIDTQSITERWQMGLITGDGYSVKIIALLPDGRKIEFGWHPKKKTQ